MLRVPGRSVLRSNERGLPVGTQAVQDTEYDFRQPRQIGSTTMDHAFTDLVRDEDGLARVELRDPDNGTGVSLWVDASYPILMLFTGDTLSTHFGAHASMISTASTIILGGLADGLRKEAQT